MAAIDKTYVTKDELLKAIEWCKNVGTVTAENGYTFEPLAFIYGYNNLDDPHYFDEEREEYVLWNTSTWFDRWLWLNCSLEFVRERLKIQYDGDILKSFENYAFTNPNNNIKLGYQHYTFLKVPTGHYRKWFMRHGRRKNPWPKKCKQTTYFIKIKSPNNFYDYLIYDDITNAWYNNNELIPIDDNYIWQFHHKNPPTKKSIIRQLRKWYIPEGYIVSVYQLRYNKMDFRILVR